MIRNQSGEFYLIERADADGISVKPTGFLIPKGNQVLCGGPVIAPGFPAFVTVCLHYKNDRIDKIAQDLQGCIMDVSRQQLTRKTQLEWCDGTQEIQEVQKAPVNPEKSR